MSEFVQNSELIAWVKLYTQDMYQWALQKVSDAAIAEDLVQDTFLAAAEKIDTFEGKSHPRTWLMSILKNKIVDHYRKTLRQTPTLTMAPEDLASFFGANDRWKKDTRPQPWGEREELMDNHAFVRIFEGCIDKLSETMNACIRLKFLAEKKAEEICQELGISTTNYWQLLHRAKLQLRDCLEKLWFRAS